MYCIKVGNKYLSKFSLDKVSEVSQGMGYKLSLMVKDCLMFSDSSKAKAVADMLCTFYSSEDFIVYEAVVQMKDELSGLYFHGSQCSADSETAKFTWQAESGLSFKNFNSVVSFKQHLSSLKCSPADKIPKIKLEYEFKELE